MCPRQFQNLFCMYILPPKLYSRNLGKGLECFEADHTNTRRTFRNDVLFEFSRPKTAYLTDFQIYLDICLYFIRVPNDLKVMDEVVISSPICPLQYAKLRCGPYTQMKSARFYGHSDFKMPNITFFLDKPLSKKNIQV